MGVELHGYSSPETVWLDSMIYILGGSPELCVSHLGVTLNVVIINCISSIHQSYHPHKIIMWRMLRYKIRPVTQRTIEVIAQKPFL